MNKKKSNETITPEVLEKLSKKYNIKSLPEDHPIYQEEPIIIIKPPSKKRD